MAHLVDTQVQRRTKIWVHMWKQVLEYRSLAKKKKKEIFFFNVVLLMGYSLVPARMGDC